MFLKNNPNFKFLKPYIIAEIGANHNGSILLAKKLILKAKKAGADCVKFQSWTKESIFSKKNYQEDILVGSIPDLI